MKRASSFLWRVWRAPDVLLWLWVGNLSTTICLYLRYRGMTPPPAPCPRKGQGAQTAFVLCSRIPPDHNPPYPPLVSALRLVCCLRVQILVVPLHVYTCSHRVFTHGAPCMGLLGPCRLKLRKGVLCILGHGTTRSNTAVYRSAVLASVRSRRPETLYAQHNLQEIR